MILATKLAVATVVLIFSAGSVWLSFFAPRQREKMPGWARECCRGQCLPKPQRSMIAEIPAYQLRDCAAVIGTVASERPAVTDVTVDDHLRNPPHYTIT